MGLSTIITFVAIYLGIIFLISGAAILALKELSESSDNRERYDVLRKIGADESMINRSLFKQIGIFFLMPLSLAVVHSVFGLQFVRKMMITIGEVNRFGSIVTTAAVLLVFTADISSPHIWAANELFRENENKKTRTCHTISVDKTVLEPPKTEIGGKCHDRTFST